MGFWFSLLNPEPPLEFLDIESMWMKLKYSWKLKHLGHDFKTLAFEYMYAQAKD